MEKLEHDRVVGALRAIVREIDPRAVAARFLASLVSAPPLEACKVLGDYAYALNFPLHPFAPSSTDLGYACIVCGTTKPAEALRGLESFAARPDVTPTAEDVARFDAILGAIAELPGEAGVTELNKALSPILLRTNKGARSVLLETLGTCSLLETLDHPGLFTRWMGAWDQEDMPSTTVETDPPAVFWRASDGVCREALEFFFPQASIGRSRLDARSAGPRTMEPALTLLPRPRGADRRLPRLELAPGDLLSLRHDERYLSAVVLGRHRDDVGECPVVEFFAGSDPAPPPLDVLRRRRARVAGPYRKAPRWRREPLALAGLQSMAGDSPRLEVRARGVAPPASAGLALPPSGYRVILSRNLLYALRSARVILPPGDG